MPAPEPRIFEDGISPQDEDNGQGERRIELEQQRRMQLTLQNLQCAMDPVIAAGVYNNNYSPLASLPKAMLRKIFIACIDIDPVSVHFLVRVCRRLRHLVHPPRIWEFAVHSGDICVADDPDLVGNAKERPRRRIQRGGMCERCEPQFALSAEVFAQWFDDMGDREGRDRPDPTIHCKFDSGALSTAHCEECGTHHDILAFSPCYRDMEWRPRCLGRQGGVQLCEHMHVYWVDIENHINHWRAQSDGEDYWDECIADFYVECHDPSHDSRCTPDGSPTWPRATLVMGHDKLNEVLLRLEWRPHSGPDAFNLTSEGQIPADEAREMLKRHQDGAPRILFPSWYLQNHPQATMCFDPRVCSHLDYKGAVAPGGTRRSLLGPDLWPDDCRWDNGYRNCHTVMPRRKGANTGVDVTQHRPTEDAVCVVTTYWTEVRVFRKTDDGKVNPDHGWFHAMDPETYDRPFPSTELLCKNEACLNYYRRPKSIRCAGQCHSPCDCFAD